MSADVALEPAESGASDGRLFFHVGAHTPSAARRDVSRYDGGTERYQSKGHVHGGIIDTTIAVGSSVLDSSAVSGQGARKT